MAEDHDGLSAPGQCELRLQHNLAHRDPYRIMKKAFHSINSLPACNDKRRFVKIQEQPPVLNDGRQQRC